MKKFLRSGQGHLEIKLELSSFTKARTVAHPSYPGGQHLGLLVTWLAL